VTRQPAPDGEPRLDVILALRRAIEVFWRDFTAVIVAGLVLVTLPSAMTRTLPTGADWATLATTLRGVCAMLYVALVSWGVVARLAGRALPPRRYLSEGLVRATPGVQVALLIGAAVVAGLTVQLFARHGTIAGWLLNSMLLTAGLLALTTLLPAVPAAVVERLGPVAALRRAAALTAGNRDRILALTLVVALALAPSGALVAGFTTHDGAGVWLNSAFELVAWSLAATVPAVVYVLLREPTGIVR
jgi:hypothetical protein